MGTQHEEWSLMQRVSQGDEAAIHTLYERFGALVYKTSYQTTGSRVEADDSVQEVFIQLWRTSDRFDPYKAKLVTWVMLITRRFLIDRLRRKQSRPTALSLDTESVASAANLSTTDVARIESDSSLMKGLRDLPELQRDVIERVYLQGFTLREVSEQLNSPLGTVKSALSRGLTRLRSRLADDRAHERL
ncbi:MAG: sigma-70 family RNA polymerase sigma factor [Phycisphaerales bacterium]|nr:sigma-70 family RNA polymerase sigma factor [Phycisphaerales bacterium]